MIEGLTVGAVVTMKKQHPCGGKDWEILRSGADFKIKCVKCGHIVMIERIKFEKGIKKIVFAF